MEVDLVSRFGAEPARIELPHGLTIDQILVAAQWDRALDPWTCVTLGGHEVAREYWHLVRPHAATEVCVYLQPAGGRGGNKQVLGLVVSIALMAAGAWVGGLAIGSLGLAATSATGMLVKGLITAGITAIGTLALSGLTKPPSLGNLVPSGVGSVEEAPRYSMRGQRNQANPYGTIPKVFGRLRMSPNIAAEPIILTTGRLQELRCLYSFGLGPVDIADVRIGDTPLLFYRDVKWVYHRAFKKGDALKLYWGDNNTVALSAKVTTDWTFQATSDADELRIEFTFPSGLVRFGTRGELNMQAVGLEIYSRVTGSGASFAPVPYTAKISWDAQAGGSVVENGHRFIDNVEVFTSFGAVGLYFSTSDRPPKVGYRLTNESGAVFVITSVGQFFPNNPDETEQSVNRQSFYQITTEPSLITGQPPFAYVWMRVTELATSNPSGPSGNFIVNANTRQPLVVVVTLSGIGGARIDLAVRRTTAEALHPTVVDDVVWTALTNVRYRSAVAPEAPIGLLELAIVATDQLSGVIDTLSATAIGVHPVWTGSGTSTAMQQTRNPAWQYVDVLLGSGNPRPVPANRIDWQAFNEWAEWCNATSPHNDLNATCDMLLEGKATIAEVLQSIAATGHASPTMRDGKYSILRERFDDVPVQAFTQRNARSFSSVRDWVDMPHALRVRYLNERSQLVEELVVYNDNYGPANATRFEVLQLIGVTRAYQAWRAARRYIAAVKLRRETFTWETDVEAIVCQRGDLVLMTHDMLRAGGTPARVLEVIDALHVRVDEFFDALPPTPRAMVRLPTGIVYRDVFATVEPDVLRLSSTEGMAKDTLIVVGEATRESIRLFVTNIAPSADLAATIEAQEEAPGILDAISGPIPDYVPPQASGTPLVSIINLTASVRNRFNELGRPIADVTLSWRLSTPVLVSEFFVDLETPFVSPSSPDPNQHFTWERRATSTVMTATLSIERLGLPAPTTIAKIRVAGRTTSGRLVLPQTISVTVTQDREAPPQVPRFNTNVQSETVLLSWGAYAPNEAPDLSYYELRFSPDPNATWNFMPNAIARVSSNTVFHVTHARSGRYAIAAVDFAGNVSPAAYSRTLIETLPAVQQYADLAGPPWIGTFVDTEAVGDALRLKPLPDGTYPAEGWFYGSEVLRFPDMWQLRLSALIDAFGFSNEYVMADWVPLSIAKPLGSAIPLSAWDVELYIRVYRDSPVLSDPWFSPLANAMPLSGFASDSASPWFRLISSDVLFAKVEWALRLVSNLSNVTPNVREARMRAELVYRQENGLDVELPAGWTRINFAHPFWYRPNVAITLESAGANDFVERVVDLYGFDVRVSNAGVPVAGRIDWTALGIGKGGTSWSSSPFLSSTQT